MIASLVNGANMAMEYYFSLKIITLKPRILRLLFNALKRKTFDLEVGSHVG
jgi:hypothetical protein